MSASPIPPRKDDPAAPRIPEPAEDGFPANKDVSIPPPGSDAAAKDKDPLTAMGETPIGKGKDDKK